MFTHENDYYYRVLSCSNNRSFPSDWLHFGQRFQSEIQNQFEISDCVQKEAGLLFPLSERGESWDKCVYLCVCHIYILTLTWWNYNDFTFLIFIDHYRVGILMEESRVNVLFWPCWLSIIDCVHLHNVSIHPCLWWITPGVIAWHDALYVLNIESMRCVVFWPQLVSDFCQFIVGL